MSYVIAAYVLVGVMISVYGISLRCRFARARKAASSGEDESNE